jgi:ADP-ribosylglycohydrolase
LARDSQLADAIMVASHGRDPRTVAALQEQTSEALSRGGFAPAVLQAAIYFVQTEACFSDALDAAIAYAGPANYCPVLVGAIGGARWGAASIPVRQLQHCVVLAQVRQSALALAQRWAV